jgi:predicted TIM-barrel fold metal-dependent hydrolase
MLPLSPPPDPHPHPPKLKCPPGAADCHFHIYGPDERYPPSPQRRSDVPDALPPACRHLHDVLGIERLVVVQPSHYGTDNRRQLDAIAALGRPARAVVAVPFDIPDAELARLHDAGARGVRFAVGPGGPSFADIVRLSQRLAPLRWHVEFHVVRSDDAPILAPALPVLRDLAVDLVIAHFASVSAARGAEHPDFRALCDLVRGGRCWAKLSGGYRISDDPPPWRNVMPLAQALVAARADRLVWGSDWPHVNLHGPMPNSTDTLDCLLDWIPDEAMRRCVLVDNPRTLYGF